jgi:hypothetical protein
MVRLCPLDNPGREPATKLTPLMIPEVKTLCLSGFLLLILDPKVPVVKGIIGCLLLPAYQRIPASGWPGYVAVALYLWLQLEYEKKPKTHAQMIIERVEATEDDEVYFPYDDEDRFWY